MILGVDAGITGCLVVLDDEYNHVAHSYMPLIQTGAKKRINGAALTAWLQEFDIKHAYLELVNAMPTNGRSMGPASAFSFGHSAGLIEGLIQGSGIPYTLVTPTKWKTNAGLKGTDKDAARSRAIQLYPLVRDLDKIKKGQALADAIFIARCAKEKL